MCTSWYLFMTSFTVQSTEIVWCFRLTLDSSTMCLFREKPLSTSACRWLIHNTALTTTMRLTYFRLPRPSFCLATSDQKSSTDATWPSTDSAHSGDISASAWYNLHSEDTESRKFNPEISKWSCLPQQKLQKLSTYIKVVADIYRARTLHPEISKWSCLPSNTDKKYYCAWAVLRAAHLNCQNIGFVGHMAKI